MTYHSRLHTSDPVSRLVVSVAVLAVPALQLGHETGFVTLTAAALVAVAVFTLTVE